MDYIQEEYFNNDIFYKLSHIPDKPSGLYIRGNSSKLKNKKFITIVGSRTCSSYAKLVTRQLISELRHYPVCIVSGLAFGIDHVAHTSSLEHNIPTIAFPGSGIDESVIYPASHRTLAQKIIDSNGVLVSEYEPKTRAARWTFPKRNRLMAGMADLVIIIEAREKSGTLITARLAMEYGTTVAVIPQNITAKHAYGSNRLIQDGAHPILSYQDILSLLHIPIKEKTELKQSYTKQEQDIIKHLTKPLSREDLYKRSGLPYHSFITLLTSLEISGDIYECYGKIQIKD